jgi:hypothetical protein
MRGNGMSKWQVTKVTPAEKPPKSVPSIFFERRAIEKEIETAGMKPPFLATGKQVAASQNVYRVRNGD